MLYHPGPDQLSQGTKSFATRAELTAFPCGGIADGSMFWLRAGELAVRFEKQTDAAAEDLPFLVRADSHAVDNCVYVLSGSWIRGRLAEVNPDTNKFHVRAASGVNPVVSGIDQTGVALP